MIQALNESPTKEASRPENAASITTPVRHTGRQGFLPIRTNTFDRFFISVVCFVAIHLLWMRFLEAYLSLWIATVLSLILAVVIVRRG